MDIVTYALLKKRIDSSSSGIKDITTKKDADDTTNLIFTMNDGSKIKVPTPMKEDCVDIEVVSALPTTNISDTTMYIIKDTDGDLIQYLHVGNEWVPIGGTKGLVEEIEDKDINDMFTGWF